MGDKARGSWNLLFMVAQKEMATSYRGEHKNSVDYFNTNAKNRIYTQTGYKLTKILKMEGGCIVPEDGIEINIISEKAFERRRKKH